MPNTSSGLKKHLISASAASGLSEAWAIFSILLLPKSPRMVPLGAIVESVGPRRSRILATAFWASRIMIMTGRELMNCSISGKKGI